MNLLASAALQGRVIYALVQQRMRSQHSESRAGYVWAIVEPLIWVFVLRMALHGSGGSQVPPIGTSFEVFFASGIAIARTWRSIVSNLSTIAARSKKSKTPSIHNIDSLYAACILDTATAWVSLALILMILQAVGYDAVPYDIVYCLLALSVSALYSLAFAINLGLMIKLFPVISRFKGLILIVCFFTSGFSFVVDRMPPAMRNLVTYNPLLHIIEMFREGFYRGYNCQSLSLNYLFMVIVAMLVVGMTAERALRRHSPHKDIPEDDSEMLA